MREAVHGAAVDNQLPVGAGVSHLVRESSYLRSRNMWIQRAVADENPGLDGAGLRGANGFETAMDADDARQVNAAARQLQDGHSAEAIADGCQTAVHLRMRSENVKAGPTARA